MARKESIVVSAKGEATVIRFPKGVLSQLKAEAAKNGRSRNSEIVYRIVGTLKSKKQAA